MYNLDGNTPRTFWFQFQDNSRNLLTASIHILTTLLICISLVQFGWYHTNGDECLPKLALYQFWAINYEAYSSILNLSVDPVSILDADCDTTFILVLMRGVIIFSFLAIIFSFSGFLFDLMGSVVGPIKVLRKYAINGIFTVIWIIVTLCLCYNISMLLENSVRNKFPFYAVKVKYGPGFYTLTTAGFTAALGTGISFFLSSLPSSEFRRHLVDNWEITEPPDDFNAPPPYTP